MKNCIAQVPYEHPSTDFEKYIAPNVSTIV
jgi:hypothetical protein